MRVLCPDRIAIWNVGFSGEENQTTQRKNPGCKGVGENQRQLFNSHASGQIVNSEISFVTFEKRFLLSSLASSYDVDQSKKIRFLIV